MLKRIKNRRPKDKVKEADYQKAMSEEITLMQKGFYLGTGGKITISRDELHERGTSVRKPSVS